MQKETTAILDKAYPAVEEALSNKTNLNKWKTFMSRFVAKKQDQLYSNIPTTNIYYSAADVDDYFIATGIDRKAIVNAIKETYYAKMPNFNPRYAKNESTIALLCMVRYFKLHKMQTELNIALINISFSGNFYASIFYGSYRIDPVDYVMEYVVNKMLSNKFDLIREGNIVGAVKSIADTWLKSYSSDKLQSFTDSDCCYLVQQLHNRIGSFVHNIATLYYKAYEEKDYITYDNDDLSDDNYHLANNDSFKLAKIVETTMNAVTTKGIDYTNCNRAANNDVKLNELKQILESIIGNKENIPIIKEYITLLVAIYFQQSKVKDVNDISFISFSIKTTPNSKDKYVIRKKELLDIILINNAEQFQRRRSRAATESSYYRSINAYFSLMIQKANK